MTFDPAKRAATIEQRGLDFADAAKLFDGRHVTAPDDRRDYGERRFITAGYLAGRMVVIVWTPRDGTRRVISMRYAHAQEAERWQRTMDRPGRRAGA
ncbi:BrnT family toxin [Acidiphilium sp. AL]|nr:BrnT family toxin [Acidiphilium sp. AL]